MFKINNENTRTAQSRRSGVFDVNFEHISHLFLDVSRDAFPMRFFRNDTN